MGIMRRLYILPPFFSPCVSTQKATPMTLHLFLLLLAMAAASLAIVTVCFAAERHRRKSLPPHGQLHLKIRTNGAFAPAPAHLFDVHFDGHDSWQITVNPYKGSPYATPRVVKVVTSTAYMPGRKAGKHNKGMHTSMDTAADHANGVWVVNYAQGSTLVEAVLVMDDGQPDVLELWFDRGWAHFTRLPLV